MKITLASAKTKKRISFKELMSRLGIHILYQMVLTAVAGLSAFNFSETKAIIIFVLLIIGNGLAVVVAFLDQSSGNFFDSAKKQIAIPDSSDTDVYETPSTSPSEITVSQLNLP